MAQAFYTLLAFVVQQPLAQANTACRLGLNEIHERVKGIGIGIGLAMLAAGDTDYKAQIVQARDTADKLALAQTLATRRLARGVLPEIDACFAALGLEIALPGTRP